MQKINPTNLSIPFFTELIKRNFNNYKVKQIEAPKAIMTDDISIVSFVIRKNVFISCNVTLFTETTTKEKGILINSFIIESKILKFLIFLSFFLTGGLTVILGYMIYRSFQSNFKKLVISIFEDYIEISDKREIDSGTLLYF